MKILFKLTLFITILIAKEDVHFDNQIKTDNVYDALIWLSLDKLINDDKTLGIKTKTDLAFTKEFKNKLKTKSITNPMYKKYIKLKDIKKDLSKLEYSHKKYYSKYIEYIAPNKKTILIIAQDKISDEQLLKAYNILSFYLSNTISYKKDAIANEMANNKATLLLLNGKDGDSLVPDKILDGQPLYQLEIPTLGDNWYINNNFDHRDASYEEILHLVHDYGIGTQDNRRSMPKLQNKIFNATQNALPNNISKWTKEGLWGLGDKDTKEWLLELREEGSLEQEYFASVVDAYYGLWSNYEEVGSMWGMYQPKNREEMIIKDPLAYEIVSSFLSSDLTYMARVNPSFNGTFKIYHDKTEPYSLKSKYLVNIQLTGKNNSNLIGNSKNNILIGNLGNNIIDGKKGTDIVQFEKSSTDYKIKIENKKIYIVDKFDPKHVDILKNIEILRFIDKDIYIKR
jgi:hypothetical protein